MSPAKQQWNTFTFTFLPSLNRIEIINYCFYSGEEKYNSSHGKPLISNGKALLLLAFPPTIFISGTSF
jgi:hypothetical protein